MVRQVGVTGWLLAAATAAIATLLRLPDQQFDGGYPAIGLALVLAAALAARWLQQNVTFAPAFSFFAALAWTPLAAVTLVSPLPTALAAGAAGLAAAASLVEIVRPRGMRRRDVRGD